MFLFWLPDFLGKRYGLDLEELRAAADRHLSDVRPRQRRGRLAVVAADEARAGASTRPRKTTMLICALLAVPMIFAAYVDNLWLAVAIIGLATAAHQGFSGNLYTLPSDLFPRSAVASVVGIGGTAGAVGGMPMAKYAGWVLDSIGSYTPLFVVAGTVYLLALGILHLLSPRYAPAVIEGST